MRLPDVDRDMVVSLRKYVAIVSHVQGRARLKISMDILRHPLLQEISKFKEEEVIAAAKKVRGVVDVRLNMMARSLVVQYDPNEIEPSDLKDFLETKEDSMAKLLLNKYMDALIL